MLLILLKQTFNSNREVEKTNHKAYEKYIIITLKTVSIFVNINIKVKRDDELQSLKLVKHK